MDLFNLENIVALMTLTAMEVILSIDNIIFLVITVNRLPQNARDIASRLGLGLAMGTRILLLIAFSWVMHLTTPLFSIFGHIISGRNLVLLIGGLFLIGKATLEMHSKIEEHSSLEEPKRVPCSIITAVVQIAILDIVFSLDSVITAVGMAQDLRIMIAAVIIAIIVMLLFAGPIGLFINRHPTLQMLAFAFLLLIGVFLVAEGLNKQINRGYIYSAMIFSLIVELLNLHIRGKS